MKEYFNLQIILVQNTQPYIKFTGQQFLSIIFGRRCVALELDLIYQTDLFHGTRLFLTP